jgi:hypothetical protein
MYSLLCCQTFIQGNYSLRSVHSHWKGRPHWELRTNGVNIHSKVRPWIMVQRSCTETYLLNDAYRRKVHRLYRWKCVRFIYNRHYLSILTELLECGASPATIRFSVFWAENDLSQILVSWKNLSTNQWWGTLHFSARDAWSHSIMGGAVVRSSNGKCAPLPTNHTLDHMLLLTFFISLQLQFAYLNWWVDGSHYKLISLTYSSNNSPRYLRKRITIPSGHGNTYVITLIKPYIKLATGN